MHHHLRISLEGLQIIDAINRRGSFAGAAEELFRVPSTITYAVQKLEDDLGMPLFRRNGHRPRLTPAGEELLKEGRLILQASTELEERLKRVSEGYEAKLPIALHPLLPCGPMLELAREFYGEPRHAQTDLCITHEIQRADLVVGATGDQGTRHTRLIGTLEFVLAASPFHPLAAQCGPVPPHVLRMQRTAVIAQRANGPKSIAVPDVQAALGALKAGLAVGFLPRVLVVRELQEGSLIEIALERPPPPENFYLVWDERPKGKAFSWLRERLDRPNLVAEWLAQGVPA